MIRISLICLLILNSCSSQKDVDTETVIVSLLEERPDCDYRFALLNYIEKRGEKVFYNGKKVDGVMAPGEWTSHRVVAFCDSNRNRVYPVLIKLMEKGKYDWTCNLLLYHITFRPADSLEQYEPNQCQKWRTEKKKSDLRYWQKFSLKE